jgi:hypothetical protein
MHTVDVANTIITHDAGSPRDQISPFWEPVAPLSYIGWGKTTQLGYGLGLAMGAKLAAPEKLCVNVWGDAAIGFTGMDFETAVRERIPDSLDSAEQLLDGDRAQDHEDRDRQVPLDRHQRRLRGDGPGLRRPRRARDRAREIVPAIRRAIRKTQEGTPCCSSSSPRRPKTSRCSRRRRCRSSTGSASCPGRGRPPRRPTGSISSGTLIDVCEQTASTPSGSRTGSPHPRRPRADDHDGRGGRADPAAQVRPSVLVAPFRSPVLAARQLAMLDYLSAGRVLPAVGIGVEQEREFLARGVPFRERGRRTDEAIRIMRQCWEEPEVTYAGEFWRLDRITVLPRPLQQPMPLWIGGNSEAAMRRAGHLGDGWIPSFITPEQFRIGVDKTLTFAAGPGREVPGDHFGPLVNFCLDPDPAAARALALPFIPRGRADAPTLEACTAFGPAGAGGRAPGAVRAGRRLEVRATAVVSAGADARSARRARGRGRARVSRPLRLAAGWGPAGEVRRGSARCRPSRGWGPLAEARL